MASRPSKLERGRPLTTRRGTRPQRSACDVFFLRPSAACTSAEAKAVAFEVRRTALHAARVPRTVLRCADHPKTHSGTVLRGADHLKTHSGTVLRGAEHPKTHSGTVLKWSRPRKTHLGTVLRWSRPRKTPSHRGPALLLHAEGWSQPPLGPLPLRSRLLAISWAASRSPKMVRCTASLSLAASATASIART